MLKARVLETLFYGCIPWNPSKGTLQPTAGPNHPLLGKINHEDPTLSKADVLVKKASTIEVGRRCPDGGFCSKIS